MCGRFAEFSTLEIQAFFPIDQVYTVVSPNDNVAPTQNILAIIRNIDLNVLERLHWGVSKAVNSVKNNSADLIRKSESGSAV